MIGRNLKDPVRVFVGISILSAFVFSCGGTQQISVETIEPITERPPHESLSSWELLHEHLNSLSQKAGVTPLRNQKLKDSETEIRIWGEIGLDNEKLMILRFGEGAPTATWYSVKRDENRSVAQKRVFDHPGAGWKSLHDYLKENQIRVPLGYSFDPTGSLPLVDEGSIVLEVNEGGKYDFVEYGQFTESVDGKSVLAVCRRVEEEFQINLGCSAS